MKKKIIVSTLATCILLSGCVPTTPTEYENNDVPKLMAIVDKTTGYAIYKHNETGVHYFCANGSYGKSVCVMVNPDGTPYTG